MRSSQGHAARRLVVALLAAAAILAPPPGLAAASGGPDVTLDPAPSPNPPGSLHRWTGTPSDVAGGVAYSHGEVVVTDSPYDDHGADLYPNTDPTEYVTGAGQGANAAGGYVPGATGGANGDYRYPADAVYARNAADIVETRLAADSQAWYLRVRLSTLIDPERTAIEARIGGHVLLVHGAHATFDGQAVDVSADSGNALFDIRVPRSVYDPGEGTHAVFVASGLWDTAAGDWYRPSAGKPPYYDLAYVPAESEDTYWRDKQQSVDIAADSFGADRFDVDFAALSDPGCVNADACPAYSGPHQGFFSRVFRSGQPLGRGVTLQTRYGQDTGTYPPNLYRSPTQPYAIYVPEHQTGAMVLLLHFLGGNHMSYALSAMPQLADWAEKLGVIVVMPLARGEGGWYEGEAEKDVFEAWRDVAAHYSVDPDRVYLTGMSMGGFGTWRLGQLYPDLFARGIVWAGPMIPNGVWAYPQDPPAPSCGDDQPPDCGYNLMDLFGNTRDLPLFVVHGGADELVPSTGAEHWMADYATGGHATYRYLFYPDRSHETSFPASTEPWVLRWLDGLPARDTDPVTVTYRLDRRFFQPRLGIQYTRAYWVHGLALAPDATTGRIDATRSTGTDTTTVLPDSYGADALGPYRLRGNDVTPPPVDPDYVHVELAHISRAILDTRRMGWSGGAQRVVGDTDSPVDLILEESSAGPAAVLGAAATQSGDSVTLHLGSGHFDVTVTPGAAAAADRARALQKARRAALRLRARLAVRGRRRALLVVSGGAPAGARVVVRLRLGGRTVARRRTTARRGLFRVRIRVRRAGRYRALVAATTPEGVRLTARTRAARALRPPARARARPSRSRRAR